MWYHNYSKRKEVSVMKRTYFCPSADIECPYCVGLEYECVIGNPEDECTDYYYYMVDMYGKDFDDEY
ncbi:MAG: hypothetical protein IKU01_01785 [Bacteroidales bacterium]|nr:hypothetical protein [Bacteroidales bacterium]